MVTSLKKIVLITSITVATTLGVTNRPFPLNRDYPGCIKPNNVSQTAMNNSIKSIFDYYKSNYVKKASKTPGGYYTKASGNGGGGSSALTVSEAHGYGMMIFAMMAGYDKDAQNIFDGYFKFYQDHPSKVNKYSMSWEVKSDETSNQDGASDGDMDIAYALLMAHYQWGSNGSINYLEEAKTLINKGIKVGDMFIENKRVALGDWAQDEKNHTNTRSSDWMPDHFRAYATATGDNFWTAAADTVYSLVKSIQDNYSSSTGLLSDFVTGTTPKPDSKAGGTGEKNGADYSYNGCRDPWRLATDYALFGTKESKDALTKISTWLRTSSNSNPDKIYAGYKLSGKKLVNYTELTFTAPFTAGLIVDANNQDFLNSCWAVIKDDKGSNEYDLALNLLSMLLVSGNWWAPVPADYSEPTEVALSNSQISEGMAANTLIATLSTVNGVAPYTYTIKSGGADFQIRNDSLFSSRSFDSKQDNPLSVLIKSVDGKGSSATSNISVTVNSADDNMVQHLAWWIDIDSYGSTSADTGAALLTTTELGVKFSTGKSNEKKDEWVYGILSCDSLNTNLSKSRFMTIEYKSTNAFTLTLQMGAVKDDAFHFAQVPVTNGEWKTVTFNIDANTFKQPSDWGDTVDFDPSDIMQFAFNTDFESDTGSLVLRNIQIDGISAKDNGQVVSVNNSVINENSFKIMGVKNSILSLSVPTSANYRLSLYNLHGQRLLSKRVDLISGVNSVKLPANLRGGIIIAKLDNGLKSIVQKLIY